MKLAYNSSFHDSVFPVNIWKQYTFLSDTVFQVVQTSTEIQNRKPSYRLCKCATLEKVGFYSAHHSGRCVVFLLSFCNLKFVLGYFIALGYILMLFVSSLCSIATTFWDFIDSTGSWETNHRLENVLALNILIFWGISFRIMLCHVLSILCTQFRWRIFSMDKMQFGFTYKSQHLKSYSSRICLIALHLVLNFIKVFKTLW